jgi:hypothetical protein
MKKILSFLLVFTLLLSLVPIGYAEEASYETGDVNCDSVINTGEATTILMYVAGQKSLDDAQKLLADANGDGRVNTGSFIFSSKAAGDLDSKYMFASFEVGVVRLYYR